MSFWREDTVEDSSCAFCHIKFPTFRHSLQSAETLRCGVSVCLNCYWEHYMINGKHKDHECPMECLRLPMELKHRRFLCPPKIIGWLNERSCQPPKCQQCYQEYSLTNPSQLPYALPCNHSICHQCVQWSKYKSTKKSWKVFCPDCSNDFEIWHKDPTAQRNRLKYSLQHHEELLDKAERLWRQETERKMRERFEDALAQCTFLKNHLPNQFNKILDKIDFLEQNLSNLREKYDFFFNQSRQGEDDFNQILDDFQEFLEQCFASIKDLEIKAEELFSKLHITDPEKSDW
ncbi:unnamed protein product, partial [Mesorhabditis belari]|uniref:RING-type domain-containing protein n=1 Tax=Mesorhabditis belari TaxID=2138241 RepID=A0AAF3J8F9_9BILA